MPSRDSARADLATALVTWKYAGSVKGYAATPAEIERILALYDQYDAQGAVACDALKGDDLPAALNQAVRHAYDFTQEARKLYSVRKAVLEGVDLCPVCGIDSADELDHHLPRSVFFPLAIYSRNLVPLCHGCNGIKLASFGDDAAGTEHFVHAYFDALPDVDFIRAKVEIVGEALVVDFRLAEDVALAQPLAQRLAGQMRSLQLNARYKAEVNTYLVGHTAALHMTHGVQGKAGVARLLRVQAKQEAKAPFHRNHWRAVLMRALAAYDDFTDGGFAKVLPIDAEMLEDLAP